jgi:hypothetical protein
MNSIETVQPMLFLSNAAAAAAVGTLAFSMPFRYSNREKLKHPKYVAPYWAATGCDVIATSSTNAQIAVWYDCMLQCPVQQCCLGSVLLNAACTEKPSL